MSKPSILGTTVLTISLLAGCASSPEQDQPVVPSEATVTATTEVTEKVETTTPPEAKIETETSIESPQQEPTITENVQTPGTSITANTEAPEPAPILVPPPSDLSENTAAPIIRSEKDIGNSYGIWALKKSNNGFCKLSSPTLQTSTSNNEYSSQIWMDIEEQRIIVNAYMSLDITHPKTGIQIDNQPLIPFTEKLYSTRAIITGDFTNELAEGKQLHIFINGEEVDKKILKRDVKLTHMNIAIRALQHCGK